MDSLRRAAIVVLVVCGLVLGMTVASLSAQGADPRVGTWKLNVSKSKFDPGPPPQSLTVKVEPAGKGEKVSNEGVAADGKAVKSGYTANFDGKDVPFTGSQIADTTSVKRINARTTERTDKKDGKVVMTLRRVVAQDGKTMTVTTKGTNADGKPTHNVLVFEKQ